MTNEVATKLSRKDPHSPGNLVASHYEAVLAYTVTSDDELYESLVETHGEEIGFNWERACKLLQTAPFFKHPRFGADLLKCHVCGSHFKTGQIWKHLPTGEHVILGCDCAFKYGMEMNMSDVELHIKRAAEARIRRRESDRKQRARAAFLQDHPGLEEALATQHHITNNLSASLLAWGNLSPAQIELAFKIAKRVAEDAAKPVEINIPAPEGLVTVQGTIIQAKFYPNSFGGAFKMTVKVVEEKGVWLCFGTIPASLNDEQGLIVGLKGKTVRFLATLKRGNDAHFALFSRPRKAEIVENTAALPF